MEVEEVTCGESPNLNEPEGEEGNKEDFWVLEKEAKAGGRRDHVLFRIPEGEGIIRVQRHKECAARQVADFSDSSRGLLIRRIAEQVHANGFFTRSFPNGQEVGSYVGGRTKRRVKSEDVVTGTKQRKQDNSTHLSLQGGSEGWK